MKCKLLLLAALCFALSSMAQQATTQKSTPGKKVVDGYTIKIVKQHDGSFGYLIYKGKERFVKQLSNPYTNSFKGLQKREDAFATARWLVKNLIAKPAIPSAENRQYLQLRLGMPLPVKLAEQLHVNTK